MKPDYTLRRETRELAHALKRSRTKLVLAESCTGGFVASLLTEVPGISRYFCGSQVVYRYPTKEKWIGVKKKSLEKYSAVSPEVAEEMVRGVLKSTPEAKIGASITGYLGPSGENIGHVYVSVMKRGSKKPITQEFWVLPPATERAYPRLKRSSKNSSLRLRLKRRELAARSLIFLVRTLLK